MPNARWNVAVRWLWLEKPTARAITATSSSPAASRSSAAFRRRLTRYSCSVKPVAPERAGEVEGRHVDGAAELLEREVLGEARAQHRLGVLDEGRWTTATARRPLLGPEGARYGGVAEPQQRLLPEQPVTAVGERAGDRPDGQVRARRQLAEQAGEARFAQPLVERVLADDDEVVAVAVVVEAAAAEHVAGVEEHRVVGAREPELVTLGADPHRHGREHDVGDLADEVLQRPADVVGRAPERPHRDERAAVQRRDPHPVAVARVPGGEAQRRAGGFRDQHHRRGS